ncbi:MAG: phosphoserine transaminase [Nitriliruptoraceae bacterium]
MTELSIPQELLPADGRFGAGPSKVRVEALENLARTGAQLLGTSHRQAPVKAQVGRLQHGIRTLFSVPDDWDVLLAVGGATAFWESLAFGFVEQRARHYSFGEFSSKFAAATRAAPWLDDPDVVESPPGTAPDATAAPGCDVQALTHNETSTGVAQTLARVDDALVVVDGTSAAGGLAFDLADVDVYYFSLQKGFASEGGLTVALCSPAATARIEEVAASGRYVPTFLDLQTALDNARRQQTYNTPSVSTIVLAADQVEWMIERFGDLVGSAARQREKAATIYDWAEQRDWATPFVADPAHRSDVVATIDLEDTVQADDVNAILRASGVVDTDGYRKLGRNQLRVAMFPAIDPDDLVAYTRCVDWVVDRLRAG